MAANKQRDHHLLQHFLLADDHAVNLPHDLRLHFAKADDLAPQSF